MFSLTSRFVIVASYCALVGCQSFAADQQADAKGVEQKESPMMVDEAKLPKGFPKPGAVGKVELKTYPAHRLARVTRQRVEGNANRMFMPLFQHIKKNEIAMTSPVEMVYAMPDEKAADEMSGEDLRKAMSMQSMAFFYGDPEMGEPGADGSVVVVEDVSAQTYASVGVRGDYTSKHMTLGVKMILQWLDAEREAGRKIEIAGSPRYMGYNSPFVPGFLKYGEVQIPVKVVEEEQR